MDIKEQLINFIEENFMVELGNGVGEDDSLLENGIIDSTGILEVILYLEENFDMKVEDDELLPENLDSINNLVNFIEHKTGK